MTDGQSEACEANPPIRVTGLTRVEDREIRLLREIADLREANAKLTSALRRIRVEATWGPNELPTQKLAVIKLVVDEALKSPHGELENTQRTPACSRVIRSGAETTPGRFLCAAVLTSKLVPNSRN